MTETTCLSGGSPRSRKTGGGISTTTLTVRVGATWEDANNPKVMIEFVDKDRRTLYFSPQEIIKLTQDLDTVLNECKKNNILSLNR